MVHLSEVLLELNSFFELWYKLYRTDLAIGYEYASSLGTNTHWLAKRGMTFRAILVALPLSPRDCFNRTSTL